MRWFETPNFDFMGMRKAALFVSGTLVLISILAIFIKGPTYGIDFSGGKEFVLEFDQAVEVTDIRNALTEPLGSSPEVKRFGKPTDILIRTDANGTVSQIQNNIMGAMQDLYPNISASVIKTDVVGPRFAEDLKEGALNAVIFAMIVIFIYILIRFKNWTFSLGAVAALAHDVLIVLGIFTLFSGISPFSMSIGESIIAAFLTIVGYSLNDTVVVYDRVRENMLEHKGMDYLPMVNKSLNETLSRTIITSLTTLFVVTILFIFGSEVLRGFSFALMVGIIIGTYSSLFVATSVVVEIQQKRQEAS